MSRINSNIPALQAVHGLGRKFDDLNTRLERLSTGLRINRGADDPAGLIASERLRSEIRGLQQSVDNSARASNVLSTAEGALNEVSALLLDLQRLVVRSANDGGLLPEEIQANQLQIDSILSSLDRVANTTTFAGSKLLDGSRSYLTSGIPVAALPSVELFAAQVPLGGTRPVSVIVTQSAQTASVSFVGTNSTGVSTSSATTIEIRGTEGSSLINIASGTTLGVIRTAINNTTAATGVSAVVSTASIAGVASALRVNSTGVGADAFVSVAPINGNLIESGNQNTTVRDAGREAKVLIAGQVAAVHGLRAEVRSRTLDTRLFLSRTFAQTLSSATFSITGGGSLFQLTPQLNPNGQTHIGLQSVGVTQLGNPVTGLLFSLRSGGANDLSSTNYTTAQKIVEQAVNQVASQRARLGNIQRNQVEPSIRTQQVAIENVTASESAIRDADIAVEVSAMTRAEILVQSTQNALQIANSLPTRVLSLLG